MESILTHITHALEKELNEADREQLRKELAEKINHLINTDFAALVQMLYRIDVNEKRLKEALQLHNNEPAGNVIADLMINSLMINRMLNIINTRKQFNTSKPDDLEEREKW